MLDIVIENGSVIDGTGRHLPRPRAGGDRDRAARSRSQLVEEFGLEPLRFLAAPVHDLAETLCGEHAIDERMDRLQHIADRGPLR